MNAERFTVTFRITVPTAQTIEEVARDIAVEQTVEIPWECIPQEHHDAGIPGRIEEITPLQQDTFQVVISYRSDLTCNTIPSLLNVLFGNISLKDNVCITGLCFPLSLARCFPGPAYGVEGIRALTGVYGRPLASTALKPLGLDVQGLAARAHSFALGGIDLIKDDHGLADQHFHPFEQRVCACREAVDRANAVTGRNCLYLPMVNGRIDEIETQVRFAVRQGVRGILIAPMLVGMDTVRHLREQYNLVIMAHPALTGTFFHDRRHGMSPAVLLGTLFRLIGADISVFPNSGGRFHFSRQECRDLAQSLRSTDVPWKPACPAPAGGMQLSRIKSMADDYGCDTVLLVGGALLQGSSDLTGATRGFVDQIRSFFQERLEQPLENAQSSCDWKTGNRQKISDVLKFKAFRWAGRVLEQYKAEGPINYRGITRQELVGQSGESTGFDLRYFEVEPGGYSSFERHVHEHVVIGVRGRGVLVKGDRTIDITPHDIGYVAPMESHQLRNNGDEPFGFYCIVDHERDRPVVVENLPI